MSVIELAQSPDLIALAGAARDAGLSALVIERPMPDAVSVIGLGRRMDLVGTGSGVVLEDSRGRTLDAESGSDPILAAGRLWRRLSMRESSSLAPEEGGLIALGGFGFDPTREPGEPWQGFPSLRWRVPELALIRVRGRTYASGDLDLLDLPDSYRGPAARTLVRRQDRGESEFVAAVAQASAQLRRGVADKVVLAREVIAQGDGVLAASAVLSSLRAAHPACYSYLIPGDDGSALVGASPELLIRRRGRQVTSQPMAGSAPRGSDEAHDRLLAAGLRRSAKDGTEHDITARAVAQSLALVATSVSASRPQVVRFADIQHLATTVRGRLPDSAPNLLEVASVLHPTPAVNGFPSAPARRLLDQLEGLERGWYAGAVGWLDGRGDGELAVALRCGLLLEDQARIYAGVGVMPDSDPQLELAETELKLRALLGALGVSARP